MTVKALKFLQKGEKRKPELSLHTTVLTMQNMETFNGLTHSNIFQAQQFYHRQNPMQITSGTNAYLQTSL